MPFGDYDPRDCENPECKRSFKPRTPWQRHCSENCNNHCTYMRVVLPKRMRQYEKRLEKTTGHADKAAEAARLKTRLAGCRAKMGVFLAGTKG